MDCQEVMNLFDLYWFQQEIISNSSPLSSSTESPKLEMKIEESPFPFPKLTHVQSRHKRSFSDQLSTQTSIDSDSSSSPRSVLTPYKLQTILSGKEITPEKKKKDSAMEKVAEKQPKLEKGRKQRRNRGGLSSKSLSDLEFEELKGFMDLGFVFSEEDKNSSLVSIIPGLQRLGQEKKDQNQEPEENQEAEEEEEEEPEEEQVEEEEEKMVVSRRPYLSEAWEVMNQARGKDIYNYQKQQLQQQPLMNWRFPSLTNEIDMKDHLRSWAHSVASTVR